MPTPSPSLAHAYRVLADSALAIGTIALILAIALHATDTGNGLPLIATAILAGLVAIAAAVQRTRYQHHP